MKVSIIIGQFPITFNIKENLNKIKQILDEANEDDLIILPEGALSGYDDDISFLKYIDLQTLNYAMNQLKSEAITRKVHIIFGSCIYQDSSWFNAAIFYSYNNDDFIYKKVNLATHERNVFKAGDELPVFDIIINNQHLKLGIQLCREIRYPEQWKALALNNAQVFVYLTNATSGDQLSVWRSHLISRAAENQRFVISSNNASKNQQCPTMLISPKGQVFEEVVSSDLEIIKKTIDIDDISNWYLSQCREDIVKIISNT